MNKIILLFVLIIAIFSLSCEEAFDQELPPVDPDMEIPEPGPDDVPREESVEEIAEPITNASCSKKADCLPKQQCINQKCSILTELYDTECQSKCNYQQITLSTSDGESYTLNKGQGSYSYAGALEWKIVPVPDYCFMGLPLVPIKLIKKNLGQILGEEIITLREGETSNIITHPTITRVSFTAKLDSVEEVCG